MVPIFFCCFSNCQECAKGDPVVDDEMKKNENIKTKKCGVD